MRLALLFLCVATAAPAQTLHSSFRTGGKSRVFPGVGGDRAALRVLPEGNTNGMPVTGEICDVHSSELTGNWICQYGDGTVRSGSQTVTALSAPATESRSMCPNGPDCASVTRKKFDGTDDGYAAAIAAPAGDWSLCMLVRLDAAGTFVVAGRDNGSVTQRGFELDVGTSAGASSSFIYSPNGGASCQAGGYAAPRGLENLYCVTYDSVSAGNDNVLRFYVNGVLNGSAATSCPAMTSTEEWTWGARNDTYFPGWLNGSIRSVFLTEKLLSAATVLAMSETAFGKLTGSKGEAVTVDKTTGEHVCENNAGNEFTYIVDPRPCIRDDGKIRTEHATTNFLLRSEEFGNAAWTDVATPGVASDTWTAPDASLTGDTLTDNNAAAFECRRQRATTNVQANYMASVYVRAGTATTARIVMTGVGNSDGNITCDFTGLISGVQRPLCPTTTPFGAGLSAIDVDICVGNTAATTGTLDVWGAQLDDGRTFHTSYIRTAGSTVVRGDDRVYTATPLANADGSSWCIAATVDLDLREWDVSDVGGNEGIITIGDPALANGAGLYITGLTGKIALAVLDNAGDHLCVEAPKPSNAIHHVRGCSVGGALKIYVDGVAQTTADCTSGSPGTGTITTMVTPSDLATLGPTVGLLLNGLATDFCWGKGPASCQ